VSAQFPPAPGTERGLALLRSGLAELARLLPDHPGLRVVAGLHGSQPTGLGF
jgi:hypothetical protein